jgi:type II secretory pathway pseudopilin PulG
MRPRTNHRRGFSIIEAIIAVAVFAVMATGLMFLVLDPLLSSRHAPERTRAVFLAQEGLEATRAIRNGGWLELTDGLHGISDAGGTWTWSGGSDVSSDGYTRVVEVAPVERDGSGDIVASGGTVDPRTKLVTATVTWNPGLGGPQSVTYSTYVTNWDNFIKDDESDSDFGGGDDNGTTVTGVGDEAAVTIAPATGGISLVPSGATQVKHTNEADWNSGAYATTHSIGTGSDASVVMTGTAAWTDYNRSRNWLETTHTDFIDGTFANAAVADTGDLGAVVLNTGPQWANQASPTAAQLNDAHMLSGTDGWAVGNGGVIARWNGTSWSAVTSPTVENLYGVACVAVSDCWAVGASGKVLRWNGSAWSQFADLGAQVFRGIRMVSATEGWIVGDGGAAFRWNGASWTAETSTVTSNLTGIAGYAPTIGMGGSVDETTDADFTSGTFTGTAVTGTGPGGSVALSVSTGWITLASPTVQQLNDIHVRTASDGWAVGNGGTVLRWDGSTWSAVSFPDGDNVLGVSAVSATDAWASGSNGRIWHWNGTAWSRYADYGGQTWNDISCPTATNCFVVNSGSSNQIYRWTGSGAFTAMTDPGGNQTWFGISCVSATQCWTAGNSGQVGWMNGTSWSEIQDSGNQTLYGVHMLDANTGFIVGDSGDVRRCTGGGCDVSAEWLTADLGSQSFRAVSAVSSSLAFAVGLSGTIYRWNGSAWSAEASPTGNSFYAAAAVSASQVFAVGQGGVIGYYGPSYGALGTYVSSALDSGSGSSSWGTLSWTETLPSGTDLTIATRTSADAAIWSAWSAEQTNPAGGAVVSPLGRYIQYRVTVTSGAATVTPSLDSINVTYDSSTPGMFAVADDGVIIGRNASGWSVMADLGTHVFRGADCASVADCWAVADSGRIAKWDGSTWSQFVDLGAQTFNAVGMTSATFGWAVGNGGVIYQWNGSAWVSSTSPTANDLYGVSAPSMSYGTAVGASGTILGFATAFFSSGVYESSVYDAGESVTWYQAAWDEFLPAGANITVATRTGPTPTPGGAGWSSWSAELTDQLGSAIASPANRYFQYRASLSTANQAVTPRLNSVIVTYNVPAPSDYYELWMASTDDGWAVGTGGAIAHWDGTGWSAWPSPVTASLDGMDGIAADDIWAIGLSGTIVHWDGAAWTQVSSPTTQTIWDVKCLNASDCRAVGPGGLMIRYNGSSWQTESTGTGADLEFVGYVASNDVWVAGDGGVVLHYNGSSWSTFADYGSMNWHGVYMNSATDGWLVGDLGNIRRWNGSAWVNVASPTTTLLQDVECASANFCWIIGDGGVILKYDGVSWQTATSPTSSNIESVSIINETDAWAVAHNRTFLQFRSEYPPSATWTSPVVDSGTVGTPWNIIAWDAIRPLQTDVTVATRTGPTPTPDGAWSGWSSEYLEPGGSDIVSPDNRYMQYRVTFTTGVSVSTPQLDEVRVTHSALTLEPLLGIDGIAATDAWVVGGGGFTAHYDGTGWTPVPSTVSVDLNAVFAVASDDVWAVGAAGVILHWDGSTWASLSSPTTDDLFGIAMLSAGSGFAVGDAGRIISWNGSGWSNVSSPTADSLADVSFVSASSGFAVGEGGRMLEWNGIGWSNYASYTVEDLNGVDCLAGAGCLIVGNDGVIGFYDLSNLTYPPSPVVSHLNDVSWRNSTEAWAVGDFGATLVWDGLVWDNITSPTTKPLYAISHVTDAMAWVCGGDGTILALQASAGSGTYGEYSSAVLDTGNAASAFFEAYLSYELPAGTTVDVAFRSGPTAAPDGSWSAWTADQPAAEILPVSVPDNRYFQYRLTLTTANPLTPPTVGTVSITFQQ